MLTTCRRVVPFVSIALAVAALSGVATSARAEFQEVASFAADSLTLENLIGEIRVEGGGAEFRVQVDVRGGDASRESIRIEKKDGAAATLSVRFPLESERRYVYPRLGRGSKSTFEPGSGLKKIFGAGRIKVSGSGSGMEVWADVTVTVPTNGSLRVRHGVGDVTVADVDGKIDVRVQSGAVSADGVRGELSVDTGSGRVEVADAEGPVNVDTGSGRVVLSGARGPEIEIDTGSGGVEAESVSCDLLSIDTGSGSVRAAAIRARKVSIDTGSGSVELRLDETGDVDIDTGSGSITLELPADASARIEAETGSGGIRVGRTGVELLRQERDEVAVKIGDGAAHMSLQTGSGSIKIK
jgi:hypothetical protein